MGNAVRCRSGVRQGVLRHAGEGVARLRRQRNGGSVVRVAKEFCGAAVPCHCAGVLVAGDGRRRCAAGRRGG
ncbi:hypothetical protein DSECCO2_654770 [anaerobic digester metagenome]